MRGPCAREGGAHGPGVGEKEKDRREEPDGIAARPRPLGGVTLRDGEAVVLGEHEVDLVALVEHVEAAE